MRLKLLTILIVAASLAPTAHANTVVDLDFVADGDGQFTDFFSNGFAVVDPSTIGVAGTAPNGMYAIGTTMLQGSDVRTFNSGNWAGVGSVTLDGTSTGTGIESFPILDATFDFNQYAEGGVLSVLASPLTNNGNYLTNMSNVSGTVSLFNGDLTGISMTSNIGFEFVNAGSYDGTLTITNNEFDLLVDDTVDVGPPFGGIRHGWDFSGSVSVSAIPEPSSLAFIGILGIACSLRKRRH